MGRWVGRCQMHRMTTGSKIDGNRSSDGRFADPAFAQHHHQSMLVLFNRINQFETAAARKEELVMPHSAEQVTLPTFPKAKPARRLTPTMFLGLEWHLMPWQ